MENEDRRHGPRRAADQLLMDRVADLEKWKDETVRLVESQGRRIEALARDLNANTEITRELKRDIHNNTATTNLIAEDTKALRDFVIGSRRAGAFMVALSARLRWMVRNVIYPLALLGAVLYIASHGWHVPEWVRLLIP